MKEYLGIDPAKIIYRSIRYWLSSVRYDLRHRHSLRSKIDSIRLLKKSKTGARCFVFGNGPSLGRIDPNKVKRFQSDGFDVFATNQYLCSDFASTVVPDFYLLSDPLTFQGTNGRRVDPLLEQDIACLRDRLNEENKMVLLAPVDQKKRNAFSLKTFYFNDFENPFSKNAVNVTRPRGYQSISGYKALAVACYMGYREIFIAGLDNSGFKNLFVDSENQLIEYRDHFYGANRPPIAHKISNSIGHHLYSLHFSFVDAALFPKESIRNLDPDGLIDFFPKNHNLDIYLS